MNYGRKLGQEQGEMEDGHVFIHCHRIIAPFISTPLPLLLPCAADHWDFHFSVVIGVVRMTPFGLISFCSFALAIRPGAFFSFFFFCFFWL